MQLPRPMICTVCREIEQALDEMWSSASPAAAEKLQTGLKQWVEDLSEVGEEKPVVPQELLDLSKAHRQLGIMESPFSRLLYRKLSHEARTGHKVRFPWAR